MAPASPPNEIVTGAPDPASTATSEPTGADDMTDLIRRLTAWMGLLAKPGKKRRRPAPRPRQMSSGPPLASIV
ncbi:hypothetical protein FNH08_48100, partial [Streptomyces spongiae]|nr:hypothetical protein [Streptomyces spongiae]